MGREDRRLGRLRSREFGKYLPLAEALRGEGSRHGIALAWLGLEDVPDRLRPLAPDPGSFASGKAVTERLLDACRLGIPELPLLIGIGAAETYLLSERNGYELSTRGSRLLDGVLRNLQRIAEGDTKARSSIDPLRNGVGRWATKAQADLVKIMDYPGPEDPEHDPDDPGNPYEDVTYGEYTYGTEMEHLGDAAAAMSSLVDVAIATFATTPDSKRAMPDPSSPSLLANADRWPAVAALKNVLEEALGNAGSGFDYAGSPDDFREFHAGATEAAARWLLARFCEE